MIFQFESHGYHKKGLTPISRYLIGLCKAIAQMSGTSVEMIERHYGDLASDAAVRALGELAL